MERHLDIEAIKRGNPVEEVIGTRTALKGNMALCPFHDDHNPSLSVDIKNQRWRCFVCNVGGDAIEFVKLFHKTDFKGALEILQAQSVSVETSMQPNCEYIYRNEAGEHYIKMVRVTNGSGGKRFAAYSWMNDRWVTGLQGKEPVLYNLPELANPDTIYIAEGEKCCDTLSSLGLTATTSPFGAGKWKSAFACHFIGKRVIVFEDNDQPGRDHARMIIASLLGKAVDVRLISFPELPEKGDIADWLMTHSKDELLQLIETTPAITVLPPEADKQKKKGLELTSLRDLLAEPDQVVNWVVDGLLSSGGLSIFVAKPKVGKSTLARQLSLCVSRGEDFLGRNTTQGAVVYLAFEERRPDVKAHFARMGATSADEGIEIFAGMAPADAIVLVREMAEFKRPSLIIVDTLARFARFKDSNDYSQTTSGIEPILALARETGSHVCLLHHAKKGDGKGIDSILGSTALAGSVDTIVIVHRSDKFRTISTIQRAGQDLPETVLDFDPDRGWSALAGTKEDCEISQVRQEILDFLSGQTEALPEAAIGEEIEGKKAYKVKTLRQLVAEGKVVRLSEGKKNNPYLYHHAGILVPSISPVPEYQNQKTDLTHCNPKADAGIAQSDLFTSQAVCSEPEIDYDALERDAIQSDFGPYEGSDD